MDHLTSPKLTAGVHCLNLRHKGMFVTSGPDPDEFTFYDKYDSTAYWCVETQRGFGPDGHPSARLLLGRARLLQTLTPNAKLRERFSCRMARDWLSRAHPVPNRLPSRTITVAIAA